MSLKTALILISFFIAAVNSFYLQPSSSSSEERNQHSHWKRGGHDSFEANRGAECRPGEQCNSGSSKSSSSSSEEKPEGLRGERMRVRYSSSSEEDSNQSHEIRLAQKQYHDAVPYKSGSHVNFDAPNFQNTINKDMQ